MVELLVENDCDPDIRNKYNKYPKDIAQTQSNREILELLSHATHHSLGLKHNNDSDHSMHYQSRDVSPDPTNWTTTNNNNSNDTSNNKNISDNPNKSDESGAEDNNNTGNVQVVSSDDEVNISTMRDGDVTPDGSPVPEAEAVANGGFSDTQSLQPSQASQASQSSHVSGKEKEKENENEKKQEKETNKDDDGLTPSLPKRTTMAQLHSLTDETHQLPVLGAFLDKKKNKAPYTYQRRWVTVSKPYLLWNDKRIEITEFSLYKVLLLF